jgi:hypothetical protein
MIFFKESQMPVYYCIDLSEPYMLVIIAEDGCNSIKQIERRDEVQRMFNAFYDEQLGARPAIYQPITEDEFFFVYTNVQHVLESNHSKFFHKYFSL